MHHKFVMVSALTVPTFTCALTVSDKNVQNIGLKRNIN